MDWTLAHKMMELAELDQLHRTLRSKSANELSALLVDVTEEIFVFNERLERLEKLKRVALSEVTSAEISEAKSTQAALRKAETKRRYLSFKLGLGDDGQLSDIESLNERPSSKAGSKSGGIGAVIGSLGASLGGRRPPVEQMSYSSNVDAVQQYSTAQFTERSRPSTGYSKAVSDELTARREAKKRPSTRLSLDGKAKPSHQNPPPFSNRNGVPVELDAIAWLEIAATMGDAPSIVLLKAETQRGSQSAGASPHKARKGGSRDAVGTLQLPVASGATPSESPKSSVASSDGARSDAATEEAEQAAGSASSRGTPSRKPPASLLLQLPGADGASNAELDELRALFASHRGEE